jgi:hypothetical protein
MNCSGSRLYKSALEAVKQSNQKKILTTIIVVIPVTPVKRTLTTETMTKNVCTVPLCPLLKNAEP